MAGGTAAASTPGRGECCHPALGPGGLRRIQVGAPAKSLPVFQQNVIKTFEDICFQLRQMRIYPGGKKKKVVSLENSQPALVL